LGMKIEKNSAAGCRRKITARNSMLILLRQTQFYYTNFDF